MVFSDLVASYSPTGDIVTLTLVFLLLIIIRTAYEFYSANNFSLFRISMVYIAIAAISNLAFFELCLMPVEHVALIYLFRDVYHVALTMALCIYVAYVVNLVNLHNDGDKKVKSLALAIGIAGSILDVLSPVTHFGFYRDAATGLWYDSIIFKPYSVTYIVLLLIIAAVLIARRNRIIKQVQVCFTLTELGCATLMILGSSFNHNSYAAFTFILPLIPALILLHTNPFDMLTGSMSRDAFHTYISYVQKNKKSIDYMILNLSLDNEQDIPIEMGKTLYNFWTKTFSKASLFRLNPGTYILAIDSPKDSIEERKEKIRQLIEDPFRNAYESFLIDYKIQVYQNIDFASDPEQFIMTIDYRNENMERNSVFFATESQVHSLKNVDYISAQLKDIVSKGDPNDPRVLAYFQPVYNTSTGKYDTAEALMRLQLPEMGLVFPDKFIHIAELMGYIHGLSKIMLHKTCQAVKSVEAMGYPLSRVSVNFSISELRSRTFCSELLQIIEANQVEYKKIAIELTETTNDRDYTILMDRVAFLQKYGICFYLDDFGTGYSNFDRILRLGLDIVKFDRSLLLIADEDSNVKFTLHHFSDAFRELGCHVLFEGVETQDHQILCESCHADYLQGYKYSKPISLPDYLDFLTAKSQEQPYS